MCTMLPQVHKHLVPQGHNIYIYTCINIFILPQVHNVTSETLTTSSQQQTRKHEHFIYHEHIVDANTQA